MKTQLKRFSKSTLSVLLSLCMLVSCMTVGIIATDAARLMCDSVGNGVQGGHTVYFVNTGVWSNVYHHFWGNNWNNYEAMTQISNTGIYYKSYSNDYNSDGFNFNNSKSSSGGTSARNDWVTSNVAYSGDNNMNYQTDLTKLNGTAKIISMVQGTNGNYTKTSNTNCVATVSSINLVSGNTYTSSTSDSTGSKDEAECYPAYGATVDYSASASGGYEFKGFSTTNSSSLPSVSGSMSVVSTAFNGNGNPATVYAYFALKKYTITYKDQGNVAFTGTHESGYPTTHTYGIATTLKTATKTNYTFGGWFTNSDCTGTAVTSLGATAYTSNITLYAKWTPNLQALSAPTNVKLDNSAADCTVNTTTVGAKISLTWDAVTNAGSYKVYKGNTLVDTVTATTSYSIERAHSSTGKYTVVAVPTDTNSYRESEKSTGYTLTVNKTKLQNPTVSVDKTDIKNGDTVNLTVTDTNSAYTAAQYDYYYYTGSSVTISNDYKLTAGTPKALTPTLDTTYKVCAYPVNGSSNDYYTQSDAEEADEVKVYANPAYRIVGDSNFIGSSTWTYNDGKDITNYISNGIYYFATNSVSSGNHYFKFYYSNGDSYSGDNNDSNCSITLGESNKYTLTKNTHAKSFVVNGSGVFIVYYDTVNGQIWVDQNTWTVTTHAYFQSYNLVSDTHNNPEEGTTGGTISPTPEVLVNKNSSTTLTATAESGYTFMGWYTNSDFTDAHRIANSNVASFTYTPSGNVTLYALFKKDTPAHYNLTLSFDSTLATVSATYNGNTINTNGASISIPVGATVTYSVSAKTGCQIDSITPAELNLTSGSNNTFTMPNSATTLTVTASKINYTLTGVVSPSYGNIKFYSNSACTTEINSAQYNTTFYAKYSPPSDYYTLGSFSFSGTGTTKTATNGNIGTFIMGTSNATITANVVATIPTFTAYPGIEVYAGESFTYTGAVVSPAANSTLTLSYSFNGGAYQSSNTFTAPSTAGSYDLTIKATNQPAGISTAAEATKTVSITVKYREHSVAYYVDMHNNDMDGKSVSLAVVTNSSGNTVKTNTAGAPCSATLEKQGTSTVYAATIVTPVVQSGSGYSALYFRITYDGKNYVKDLNTNQISKMVTTNEVWLEAVNESSQPLSLTYSTDSTPGTGSTPAVAEGYRRIYLAKPYSWQTSDTSWTNIGVYHWGGYNDIGWDNGIKMTYLGYDSTGADGYHYYYVDLPKYVKNAENNSIIVSTAAEGVKVQNIIFQGWGSNTTAGSYTKSQTGNIENIADSANYYVLSKDGNSVNATKGTDAVIPSFARHAVTVNLNKGETASIVPTYVGESVTYTSSDTSKVTVSSAGVITAVDSTINSSQTDEPVTITVKVKGTIGDKITAGTSNGGDAVIYTVTVSVHDPGKFNGFNRMSLESKTYTVNVPKVGNDNPGYFDMSNVKMVVTGISGLASSENSAIITEGEKITVGEQEKPVSFTVKYAKANSDFSGYSNIQVTGEVVTKSIKHTTTGQRYGFDYWQVDGARDDTLTATTSISDGIETATTKNIVFNSAKNIYSAVFDTYDYVDVTFIFDYYDYVPKVVDGMTEYPYDSTYAGTENRFDAGFNTGDYEGTHANKTYTITDYEVRDCTANTITPANLMASSQTMSVVRKALKDIPANNYYVYTIDATNANTIPSGEINRDGEHFKATVHVHLFHSVKHYSVYFNNGSLSARGDLSGNQYTYQQEATLTAPNSSKWYTYNYSNGAQEAMVADGTTSYKFRVKGNTDIRTEAGSLTGASFNCSEVGFSGYGIDYKNNKEYLFQNFFIADFFDKTKFEDLERGDGSLADDATFVGGGVVYYSMKNNTPNSNAVNLGYVNSNGTINGDAVKQMLKEQIIAGVNSTNYTGVTDYKTLASAIGTEDANKVAYGTEIEAHQYVDNGIKSGVLFRYLPYESFSNDSNNWENGVPKKNEKGNYYTNVNNNIFRYSNTLQSYQYIYASGNENKETNAGKDMRLYSYYIYSYLTYNEDNVPETKYEILLSDRYSDASTYWTGSNN